MSKITVANLTCIQCGNSFPLNSNSKPTSITCPFCQTDVSSKMIEQIYNAIGTVADVNFQFRSNSIEDPVFELSVSEQEVKLATDGTL